MRLFLVARSIPDQMARVSKRRCVGSRSAAAAAELALVLPFLALLFAAVLDFGRVYYASQTLEECASVAALMASGNAQYSPEVGSTLAAVNAAIANGTTLNPPLTAQNVSVVVTATTVNITVTYNFVLLTPILSNSGSITLTRTASMNVAPVPGS